MSCASPRMPDPGLLEAGLAAVPDWRAASVDDRVEPLPSGGINHNFRVTTAAGQYLLRLSQAADRVAALGIDRAREAALLAAAAHAGLAPTPVATAPDGRWQVRRYLPGRVWTPLDLDSPHQLARLMQWLQALHRVPVPDCRPLDPLVLVRQWCRALQLAGDRAAGHEASVRQALRVIDPRRRVPCIVHSDLHVGNIVEGDALQVIDWEYAQVADPLADLGALLATHPQLTSQRAQLLEAAGLAGQASDEELAAWVQIYRCINSLWQSVAWES